MTGMPSWSAVTAGDPHRGGGTVMSEQVERCTYCGGTYPHQAPTGCWTLDKEGGPGIWSSGDPYIIWKYYIGRDKGPLHGDRGLVKAFFSPGRAWKYIFEVVQPDDERACENYRVLRISEYLEAIRK